MYGLELAGEENASVAREAKTVATGVTVVAPSSVTAYGIEPERTGQLAYIRHIVELVGRCVPDTEAARAVVTAASVDREGTVVVHARDVQGLTGINTTDVECELGSALVDRGFDVDLDGPDHKL